MRTFVKWLGIVLGGLVGLILVTLLGLPPARRSFVPIRDSVTKSVDHPHPAAGTASPSPKIIPSGWILQQDIMLRTVALSFALYGYGLWNG